MDILELRAQFEKFFEDEENKKNVQEMAKKLFAASRGNWFTLERVVKKNWLTTKDKDLAFQILLPMVACGVCLMKKEGSDVMKDFKFKITDDPKFEIELINQELAILETRKAKLLVLKANAERGQKRFLEENKTGKKGNSQ